MTHVTSEDFSRDRIAIPKRRSLTLCTSDSGSNSPATPVHARFRCSTDSRSDRRFSIDDAIRTDRSRATGEIDPQRRRPQTCRSVAPDSLMVCYLYNRRKSCFAERGLNFEVSFGPDSPSIGDRPRRHLIILRRRTELMQTISSTRKLLPNRSRHIGMTAVPLLRTRRCTVIAVRGD
jgi:hypothetical protein